MEDQFLDLIVEIQFDLTAAYRKKVQSWLIEQHTGEPLLKSLDADVSDELTQAAHEILRMPKAKIRIRTGKDGKWKVMGLA